MKRRTWKVGDKVRIQTREWMDAQPKNEYGSIEFVINPNKALPRIQTTEILCPDMMTYADKEATITADGIGILGLEYKIDIDTDGFYWTDEMFQ